MMSIYSLHICALGAGSNREEACEAPWLSWSPGTAGDTCLIPGDKAQVEDPRQSVVGICRQERGEQLS